MCDGTPRRRWPVHHCHPDRFCRRACECGRRVSRRDGEPGRLFLAVLTVAAILAAVGAALFMMAGVGIAIRDIARNSFWRPLMPALPKPTIGEVELELEQRT